jgi:exopolyphosphatase/guanosine-5'-triphosphate,3'-diphosphate pyrophosphatase
MRIAAIDIGTNSTKMTVADCEAVGTLLVIAEDSEVTRLGQGVDATKRLETEAMDRTLAAITRFADAARAQGAEKILAAGTSALRDAVNGPEFLRQVEARAGVRVEIITGEREAQLAYAAVRSDAALNLPKESWRLVFDIGGGSTELILGHGNSVDRHDSLNVGAVRLTERFLLADPPTQGQIDQASRFAEELLAGFPVPEAAPCVIGIGGTVINLASVACALPRTDPNAVHASLLSAAEVKTALARFLAVPAADRRGISGLEPQRADIIIGGALVLVCLLNHFQADHFTVSARGLRYGLLAEAAAA